MAKQRSSRRTHKQLRAAGIDDAGAMTMMNSIGPCCKMWFPDTETSGTTITDVVNGVVITPSSISFPGPGLVRLVSDAGHPLVAGSGLAPTSGVFPTIGTQDFILFSVQKYNSAVDRANTYFGLHNASDDLICVYDGDGATVRNNNPSRVHADTESFMGQDIAVLPKYVANAVVRHGSSIGNWVHAQDGNPITQGNTVGTGDVYCRVLRNEGYIDSNPATYGRYGRNDFGFSDATIASWQYPLGYPPGTPILSEGAYTFGSGLAGVPGVWVYIDPAYDFGTPNRISIASAIPNATNDYCGKVLFVFKYGLPADFKQALRWMKDQWIIGNRALWPNWVSVE